MLNFALTTVPILNMLEKQILTSVIENYPKRKLGVTSHISRIISQQHL